MKVSIITYNEIEGVHQWKTAPEGNYLKYPHRHVFVIRCWFEVAHSDRDVEIIEKQLEINNALNWRFYNESRRMLDFEDMSCEMIAQWLIDEMSCSRVVVLEDGYGGADVKRE